MRALKFKIDENLPLEIANIFTNASYDTETVYSEKLVGATDQTLTKKCKEEKRVLITLDLDFADIRFLSQDIIPGIIVIRTEDQTVDSIKPIIKSLIKKIDKGEVPLKKLWIVDEEKIRIRDLL